VVRVLIDLANQQNLSLDLEDNEGLTAFNIAICEHGEGAYVLAAFLRQGFSLDKSSLDLAITGCSFDGENASKVDLVLRNWPDTPANVSPASNAAIESGALPAIRLPEKDLAPRSLTEDESEETPMHWAVKAGITSTVDSLVQSKASPNGIDAQGVPHIGHTLLSQLTEVFKALYGGDANLIVSGGPWDGSSVLAFAVSIKHSLFIAMIGFLLSGDLDECEPLRFRRLHERAYSTLGTKPRATLCSTTLLRL